MTKDLNIFNIYFLTSSVLCSLSLNGIKFLGQPFVRFFGGKETQLNLRYSVPVPWWKDSFRPTWFVYGFLCVAWVVLLFWSKIDPELFRSINFLNPCSKKPYCNYTIVLHFMIDYAPLMVWLLFSGNFSGWSFLTLLKFFSCFFKNFCLISIKKSILPSLLLQILPKLWSIDYICQIFILVM